MDPSEMRKGAYMVVRRMILVSVLLILLPALAFAENGGLKERDRISEGKSPSERTAEVLHQPSDQGLADSPRKEAPPAWEKFLKSFTLESVPEEVRGEEIIQGKRYAIRLQTQQEVGKVNDELTLSFNTQIGLITRGIDQGSIQDLFNRATHGNAALGDQRPLLQEQRILFRLELKF
jgi:hypothetical protein